MNTPTIEQIEQVAQQLSTANLQSLLVMALRRLERRGLANDSDRALLAQLEAERG